MNKKTKFKIDDYVRIWSSDSFIGKVNSYIGRCFRVTEVCENDIYRLENGWWYLEENLELSGVVGLDIIWK